MIRGGLSNVVDSNSSLIPSTVPVAYNPPFNSFALTIRVRLGVHTSLDRGEGVDVFVTPLLPTDGDRRPLLLGEGHIELSEIRFVARNWGGVVGGEEWFGLGAGGGVSLCARSRGGGVIGLRVGVADFSGPGLRRGVAWISIGKAIKTSLPVGWSRDRERLILDAVDGA